MLNCILLLKAGGRGRGFVFTSTVHEQAQSNRTCNILQFCWAFFMGFIFSVFLVGFGA